MKKVNPTTVLGLSYAIIEPNRNEAQGQDNGENARSNERGTRRVAAIHKGFRHGWMNENVA